MDDLISRAAAIEIAEKYGCNNGSALGHHSGVADCIASEIAMLPAVDAAPVVHERWIYENEGMGDYSHCSECGCRVPGGRISDLSARYKLCPNCGAKMHGERRNSE